MKSLKDRFQDFETEINEEAWRHFQMIRSNDKAVHRAYTGLWKTILFSLIGLMIGLVLIWKTLSQHPSTFSDNTKINVQQTKTSEAQNIPERNVEDEKELSSMDFENEFLSKREKEETLFSDNVQKSKNISILETSSISKLNASLRMAKSDLITNNTSSFLNLLDEEGNPGKGLQYGRTTSSSLPLASGINDMTARQFVTDRLIDTISHKMNKTSELLNNDNNIEIFIAPLEGPNIDLFYESELAVVMGAPKNIIIKKSSTSKNNHLRIGINYADFFINGTIGDIVPGYEEIEKSGYLIQGEYYRSINKILAVGLSLGYSYGQDTKNRWQDTLDYERIAFAQLNLYFFLLNERRHKLFGKIGSGFMKTERLHSYYIIQIEGNKRGLSYSNSTDRGVNLELSYQYQLNPYWALGVNYGHVIHNDGAWFTGLSLVRSF